MSTIELNNYIDDYFDLLDEVSRLQEQIEAIKDVVKYAMIEKDVEKLSGPGWSATWKSNDTTRLDTAALKEAMPEIYTKYCKTQKSNRFTLVKTKA